MQDDVEIIEDEQSDAFAVSSVVITTMMSSPVLCRLTMLMQIRLVGSHGIQLWK